MTNQEMALKVVLGKHIIEYMFTGDSAYFWKTLVNGRTERMLLAAQRALERLPMPEKFPSTDEEASDLLFRWTLPVRTEISLEFMADLKEAVAP